MEAVLTQPNTTLVDITLRDNVAILALNRPEKRNAVNNEMRSELTSALHWADQSTDVAAIVLTGQGKG
ncbi:MAG: enoyl-CoA hydratase/isomerase family protein, partial [Pseudomonadota bacterium]|nr:enoyl-CoA hydratase/isomerase family protein [Pseudomonadota bacterium]